MDGSTFPHERITAREMAERVATQHGWTFEAALLATPRTSPRDPPPTRAEAEAAAEAVRVKAEAQRVRDRAWNDRVAPLVARYGSLEAAMAPCWRENALREAVAPWRVVEPDTGGRWTLSLDGYSIFNEASDTLRRALKRAYPLPTSFAEVRTELDYWLARAGELSLLCGEEDGDPDLEVLDIVVQARTDILYGLLRRDLSVGSLQELEQRVRAITETTGPDEGEWEVVCEAIARLAASERDGVGLQIDIAARIGAELNKDRNRSDRSIARVVGCSPTTVGKVRRATPGK